MLWLFGDNVEDRMGHGRFLVFYLLCGFAAGFTHFLSNPGSIVPTIGASGAIAGVMGAYFRLFPRARIVTFVPVFFVPFMVDIPAVIYIGYWFLTQVFSGVLSLGREGSFGGIAWWAHIGGFLAGILLQRYFIVRNYGYFII